MKMTLDEQLRKLRSFRGVTQEQLAIHLGVTPQAVSKWERGEGFPDITMLPSIAGYYNVTVDHLLGLEVSDKAEKIGLYCKKEEEVLYDPAKRVALWRNVRKEFPNDTTVLHRLSFALRAEDTKANACEIILYAKQILNETKLSGEYFGALNNLCYAYAAIGDLENAKLYASMAGRYGGTENQLLIHILEGESAARFCRWNIETLTDLICTNSSVMLEKGLYSSEQRTNVIKNVIELLELVFGSEPGFYHSRLAKWHLRLAFAEQEQGLVEKAMESFQKAIHHAKAFDQLKDGKYQSALLAGHEYKGTTNSSLLEKIQSKWNSRQTES